MRCGKLWRLALCLLPSFALGETVEYTFTGQVVNDVPGAPPNIWNGPGPEPSTFTMTFDINTLSAQNSVSYTFGGGTINSISASFPATNFTLSVDGHNVLMDPVGGFGFSGTTEGPGSYIGGSFSGGNSTASFGGVPDFGLGENRQSVLMGSSDPVALLLNGSEFSSDGGDLTFFEFEDSSLIVEVSGSGRAVSAPEPSPLALMSLGGLGLALAYRRRARLESV